MMRQLSIHIVATVLAVLNTILYNIPFFQFVLSHAEMNTMVLVGFVACLIVLMLALHYWIFYLLLRTLRIGGKILIAILLVLNSACTYFVVHYHNLMDDVMMSNVFNTRFSEASEFLNPNVWIWIALLGLLPAIWLFVQRIDYRPWRQFGIASVSVLGGSLLLVLINLNQVLWIGKYDTELGGLIMPWSYIVNTGRLYAQRQAMNQSEILLPDGQWMNDEPAAFILVIGESSRRANWQLYGYQRPTNPLLASVEDLHIYTANACATYTTAGVKAILEDQPHRDLYEILPNYLYRMGADVEWRTSNWGEPPVHGARYIHRADLAQLNGVDNLYDEILLTNLKPRIEHSTHRKLCIILHTSTSHGPDYQLQYPASFERFSPVCSRVEEAQNESEYLMNAYDNSIVYTDFLLRDLIDTLRTITTHRCALLYVSDHGESLGENDLFMHGLPMRMAPKTQYEIPLLLWTSNSSWQAQSDHDGIDQHVVFSTAMRWLGLSSPIYHPHRDLFQ